MPARPGQAKPNIRDYRVATNDRRTLMDASALAREHAPAAIRALVRGLSDPQHYVVAANSLLDRGFGRPAQHQHVTTDGQVTMLHLIAARAIAAELPALDVKPVDTNVTVDADVSTAKEQPDE